MIWHIHGAQADWKVEVSRAPSVRVAELGGPEPLSAAALATYVGVMPRLQQSGKHAFSGARGLLLGNAHLRDRLWMPILVAVRRNPWLRAHYERLLAAGKWPKVAVVARIRKFLGAIYSVARNRRPFVPHGPHLDMSSQRRRVDWEV